MSRQGQCQRDSHTLLHGAMVHGGQLGQLICYHMFVSAETFMSCSFTLALARGKLP